MDKLIQISHNDIINYVQSRLLDRDLQKITKIKEKDFGYALLFQLIDSCKSKNQKTETFKHKYSHISFSNTEKILLKLLSGDFNQKDAGHFLTLLIGAPDFYSRLMIKLDTIKKTEPVQEKDLRDIRIKQDAELLAEMSAFAKSSRSFPKAAVITIINNFKKLFLIKARQPILRYSFVTISLIIFTLVGYMALKPGQIKHDIYKKYFSNHAVSLAYDSTLRGPLTRADQNTSYDTLLSQFKLGVGDYLRQKYTTALDNFEEILSRQDQLQSDRFCPLLREAHFYSGLCCLALAGESRFKKQNYLNKAGAYLLRAKELAKKYNLKGGDREHFFLGLTYDLLGEKQLALEQLGQISKDSPFKNDSEKLKDKLIHKAVKH